MSKQEVEEEEKKLRERVAALKEELQCASTALKQLRAAEDSYGNHVQLEDEEEAKEGKEAKEEEIFVSGPPYKCGYLSKWNDRASLFSKAWDKRFVVLEDGKLAYYKTHTDLSPRYILNLKNCAVRDDGSKPVRVATVTFEATSVSIQPQQLEGKFYYVFSVYQRPALNKMPATSTASLAEDDDEADIVPLLRFSTQSLAEKQQWIQLIAESCAYCDATASATPSTASNTTASPTHSPRKPAQPLPSSKKGTLPPIYFAPPALRTNLARHPSGANMSQQYTKTSKLSTSTHSHPRSVAGYPPSRPMHRKSSPSYLSAEAPHQNYRGLLNLALIILVVSNIRIVLDTMRHHGFILAHPHFISDFNNNLTRFVHAPLTDFPFWSGMAVIQACIFTSYWIEWALAYKYLPERPGVLCHAISALASLFVPMVIIWQFMADKAPFVAAALLMYGTITCMKLISYAHANADYRRQESRSHHSTVVLVTDLVEKDACLSYPQNVTLRNMYYFWFAPTLTYQMAFPRTSSYPHIRWAKIAGILFRLFLSTSFLGFLVAQVMAPHLDHLVRDLETHHGGIMTWGLLGDYVLKLAIANTYAWLLMFYSFFHLFLNLCAELLQFGDRVFYKDWWNASEVASYWRLWNMPVHYWLVRHLYFPCLRQGWSKNVATFIVFFVSAVVHEMLLSVPFHFVRLYSFLGMMMQVPLSLLTKYMDDRIPGTSVGNVIFWVTFCVVGQPMAMLFYTVDYWQMTQGGGSGSGGHGGVRCVGSACEL